MTEGTKFAITAKNGEWYKISYTAKNGEWYKISYNGIAGYVHSKYVTIQSSNNSSNNNSNTSSETAMSATGVVSNTGVSGLNIRKSPSTSSTVLGVMREGTKFTITAKSGEWYKISYNGITGYVHSKYVTIQSSGSSSNNNSGSVSGNSDAVYQNVLNIMKAQIGSPYVWGGSGEFITYESIDTLKKRFPDAAAKGWYDTILPQYYNAGYRAFDCSGLMQWAFGQAGIKISRTTYTQLYDGVGVSVASAKPGDLLIYSNQEHVGMYIGNNQWIEAPYSGAYVRISNVPWSKIGYARRVIG